MSEKTNFIYVQLTPARLEELLNNASMRGAIQAMQLCGVAMKDMLSRAELSKKFGRGKIDRMIKAGKLTPHQLDGGRSKYKLNEVITLIN